MADNQPISSEQEEDMLTQSGAILGISLRASHMNIRIPDESERLLLSEEQVDVLCRGGRDSSFDWFIALAGASFGFIQNVISVISNVYYGNTPTMVDIILSIMCAGFIAASIAKYTEYISKKTNVEFFLEKVRAGRRVSVQ